MRKTCFICLLFFVAVLGSSCNSGNEKQNTPIYDTTPKGPAPNNTDATFSSMADSAVGNPDTTKTIEVE